MPASRIALPLPISGGSPVAGVGGAADELDELEEEPAYQQVEGQESPPAPAAEDRRAA